MVDESFAPASTNIALVSYDRENQTMTVEFNDTAVYEYSGVPRSVYLAFQSAPSAGQFFRRMVMNAFPYERVG